MKINCLICGGRFELEEATKDATFRRILELAHKFGEQSRLAFEYADCFRKGLKPLPLKTQLRVLEEFWAMYENSRFLFNRREYTISRPHLIEAVKIVCNKQLNGLENHNYLKKILTNATEKGEAIQERQAEAKKQSGYRDLSQPSPIEQLGRPVPLPSRGEGRKGAEEYDENDPERPVPPTPEVLAMIGKVGKKMPGGK